MLPIFHNHTWWAHVTRVVRYGIVGVTNTLLDTGLYAILTRSIPFFMQRVLVANGISFVVTTIWSFQLNRKWTFGVSEGNPRVQYAKFFIISVVGLGISEAVLWIAVYLLGLHDLVGKILTIPAVFIWNFSMHVFWTFRVKPPLAQDRKV